MTARNGSTVTDPIAQVQAPSANGDGESNELKRRFQEADGGAAYASSAIELTIERLRQIDSQAVAAIADTLEAASDAGRSIYVMGNGGSAAVASHFVNDLGVNSWTDGRPGFRVFCLADNVASLTAVANDLSYEDVFRRQLECNLQAEDVVIALSVSGNSPNLVRAVTYANSAGAHTIALCGFDGGKLSEICETTLHVPCTKDEYGPIEDVFSVVFHALSSYLSMARGRFLAH